MKMSVVFFVGRCFGIWIGTVIMTKICYSADLHLIQILYVSLPNLRNKSMYYLLVSQLVKMEPCVVMGTDGAIYRNSACVSNRIN